MVRFLAFKNAYSYTVGVKFSFFNAQTVKEWKLLHGQRVKECIFLHAPSILRMEIITFVEEYSFLHAPYIDRSILILT